jgi:hypothetical protein
MIAMPAAAALAGLRRFPALLLLIALVFFVMIGWRYEVGYDWKNYVRLLAYAGPNTVGPPLPQSETGFELLLVMTKAFGGTVIFIDIFAAGIFCVGFFALANRMIEPFLAVTVGTPILAIVIAMSATRQAIALGVLFYTLSHWHDWSTARKAMAIVVASLFHFSALVYFVFLVLKAEIGIVWRMLLILLIAVSAFVSSRVADYSVTYMSASVVSQAPGAFYHLALIAVPAAIYWIFRRRWRSINGRSQIFEQMAIATMLCVPAAFISSNAADRLSLYFWPVAMYTIAGWPAVIDTHLLRTGYRFFVVVLSVVVMVGWLTYSNSSDAWMPYRNVLWSRGGEHGGAALSGRPFSR